MDAGQRAGDALEAVAALRSGPLADVRHELARAGHAALERIEALESGALAALEAELRKIAAGDDGDAAGAPAAGAARAAAAKAQ